MLTVLPRTNHLAASPLFEIKLFNLTVFSSFFFIFCISCTYGQPVLPDWAGWASFDRLGPENNALGG